MVWTSGHFRKSFFRALQDSYIRQVGENLSLILALQNKHYARLLRGVWDLRGVTGNGDCIFKIDYAFAKMRSLLRERR